MQQQADRHENKVAFGLSYNGDDEGRSEAAYRELDLKAPIVSISRCQGVARERALVLRRPGLDSIVGCFGCLYGGALLPFWYTSNACRVRRNFAGLSTRSTPRPPNAMDFSRTRCLSCSRLDVRAPTSGGMTQGGACRQRILDRSLQTVAESRLLSGVLECGADLSAALAHRCDLRA